MGGNNGNKKSPTLSIHTLYPSPARVYGIYIIIYIF